MLGRVLEGGGQIIRNGLAFSAIFSLPASITHIRGGRSKPGLRNQHAVGALALADLCNAENSGIFVQSEELSFRPRRAKAAGSRGDGDGGDSEAGTGASSDARRVLKCECEGAGSVGLLIQSTLPALLFSEDCSEAVFVGGTIVVRASLPANCLEQCVVQKCAAGPGSLIRGVCA